MKLLLVLWLALTISGHSKVIRDLPYAGEGSHPRQKLDLYLPDEKNDQKRPIFIIIHGGGWSIGDKSNARFTAAKVPWLIDSGYVVASLNYRLAPEFKHPAPIEDVCKAIAWLAKNASDHGGDPKRIFLLGHSAGAQLAALAAVDTARLKAAGVDPSVIRGAVLLDGAGYDIPRLYPLLPEGSAAQDMYRNAFSSDAIKQRDASPAHRISADPPPFLILHLGSRPSSGLQSRLLANALTEKGGKAIVTPIPDKTHATINIDCGKPNDPVTKAIEAFLH